MSFWDSSAVAPLLFPEEASKLRLSQVAAGDSMLVWWAVSVECMSAIQRRARSGLLSEAEANAAIKNLRVMENTWTEIAPTAELRQEAERLLLTHPLRAADALQLAAAIIGADHEPDGMIFYTGDARLAEAAAKEGFKVA